MATIASFRMTNACIDENIAERVTQALWSNPFIDPTGVSIKVAAGQVVLGGTVCTAQEIEVAREILDDLYCCEDVTIDLKLTAGHGMALSTAA